MFLVSLARAIVRSQAGSDREDRRLARLTTQQRREQLKAERRERNKVKPDRRMISFHKRIDRLGLAPDLTDAFKKLTGNEQRRLAEAAGDALSAAIPLYLAIGPEKRRDGLAYAKRGRREPFIERLSDFLKQSRRTLADDDAELI